MRSPKTRLRWRWDRIGSLALGLALATLWFTAAYVGAQYVTERTVNSVALIILLTLIGAYFLTLVTTSIIAVIGMFLPTRRRARRK